MSNVKSQPTKLKPSKNQKGRRRREKKRGGEGRITKGKGIDTKKLLECKNNTWAYYGTLRYPGSGGVDHITQHHPRGNWHLEQDWGEEEPIFMSNSPSRGSPVTRSTAESLTGSVLPSSAHTHMITSTFLCVVLLYLSKSPCKSVM